MDIDFNQDLILVGTRDFRSSRETVNYNPYILMTELAKKQSSGWKFRVTTIMDDKCTRYYVEVIKRNSENFSKEVPLKATAGRLNDKTKDPPTRILDHK